MQKTRKERKERGGCQINELGEAEGFRKTSGGVRGMKRGFGGNRRRERRRLVLLTGRTAANTLRPWL